MSNVERYNNCGYLPPLPDHDLKAKADKLQELIERSQRNKWIAADREAGIVRVDTRDEQTVEKVAESIRRQLVLYTLPANFPLNFEHHREVAERCAPLIATAVLTALEES